MSAVPDDEALIRVRVIRRDQYRCQWRHRPGMPPCGEYAPMVGTTLYSDDIVALCLRHSLG